MSDKETDGERIVRLEVTVSNLHQHFIAHDKEEMEWRVQHDQTMKTFTDKMDASLNALQKTQDKWQYGWKGALVVLGAVWVLLSGGLEKAILILKKIFFAP